MNTNFNFVVNEDDLLKALESGTTMEQIKNIFNSAINRAADKQLQKQKEEQEKLIQKQRDEGLRDALDYLLDWYDTYYGEFDYTAPHAVITPQVRERALSFARYIITEYKLKEEKEKNNNVVAESCNCATDPKAEKKEDFDVSNSGVNAKKKPEVKAHVYKTHDPKEINRILEHFFDQYEL